ncbi:SUMF1/EgtB/PvdO family nonheme iron enzyme [Candidatus Eisenbacteria bacterium]|uniref:SUMF1/EgtB/PvdO family nonheme iron enzyme n=1 Tax=Eiseniibacteriota bacterium TaxID=2212470 RepID=A0ABV6YKB6_UNCEI
MATDAEWEYAAQYNDERTYPWGNEEANCDRANYYPPAGMCVGSTSPVGSYPGAPLINEEVFYDMAGNLWEWCNDWHECDLGTTPQTNPTGPATGVRRVLRGGSYDHNADWLRCARRYRDVPETTYYTFGFRAAKSAELILASACCFSDRTCALLLSTECDSAGGIWHEGIETCDPNPCPGVCCLDEICGLVQQSVCDSVGGEWFSDLGSCDPNPCLPVFTYYFPEDLCARPGDTLTVAVNGRNDASLWGYGINFVFDPAVFECTGMTVDGTRGEDPWGDPPASTCATDYARIGVVYSISCPPEIEPGDGAFLKVFLYVKPDAPLGPTVLDLADAPPTYNRMSLCNAETAYPQLIDGVAMIDTSVCAVNVLEGDRVDTDTGLRILGLRPNPTTGGSEIVYQVAYRGPVSVEIYDLSGRVVWTQRSESLSAGVHRQTWDGRDMQGREVGAGTYFARVRSATKASRRQLLVVR